MDTIISAILQKEKENPDKQIIIAIAGIPGSGKSTLASVLASKLPNATAVGLDGYHIPREKLTEDQHKYRGRFDTFDMAKFKADFTKFKAQMADKTQKEDFYFPSFDHKVKDPVENDIKVSRSAKFVIFEGLYLLIEEVNMVNEFDVSVFIKCDLNIAMERVIKRNFEAGICPTLELTKARTWDNDCKNAKFVIEKSNKEKVIYYETSD